MNRNLLSEQFVIKKPRQTGKVFISFKDYFKITKQIAAQFRAFLTHHANKATKGLETIVKSKWSTFVFQNDVAKENIHSNNERN